MKATAKHILKEVSNLSISLVALTLGIIFIISYSTAGTVAGLVSLILSLHFFSKTRLWKEIDKLATKLYDFAVDED